MADRDSATRRRFLALSAVAATGLAGCTGGSSQETQTTTNATTTGSGNETGVDLFQGSGPLAENRPELSGTRIEELPALSGTLNVYLGGGEGGLYRNLLDRLGNIYSDFTPKVRSAPSAQLANTIVEESRGGSSPADVFWAVDAGSLAYVSQNGLTTELPTDVTDPVPDTFHPNDQWVGVAGRARSVPYNTDQFSADDIPNKVAEFTGNDGLSGSMGWAPTYGAFQSFVTAMRLLRGEQTTKQWLRGMLEQNVTEYPNEFLVSNAVADGEIGAGFANHYYALRVKAARPNAPIDLAFTRNDAASLINVSGAEILKGSDDQELAANFIDHLLTVEAQEFFATTTFAYPMIPGVPPVGGLPSIDELNPPELDLQKLSNLEPTLRLMREVGVL
ncbi:MULTISPECIES: extracellular solute-binding protein [Halorussus]|uniref:extracellular solute-binding protein n=1 Tax=Halorussus TaxID=1070314 RepID=UPI000E2184BC|nr:MULTISPECIES: extracellular solute-binding protein [Halorussus]NHN58712.1 extracellular solute-binding protein [Halorussus sp. JP-T4]